MADGIQDQKMARRLQEDQLARDIIDECRVQLMLKFRFLDSALWRMGLEPMRVGARYPLATDGERVVLDPPRVIARFSESFDESIRDYLHLVMHCIFRHPFAKGRDNREAWELACDMLVEGAVMDLVGGRFESEDDAARRSVLDEVRMLCGSLAPGKVYGLLRALVLTPEGQQHRGIGRGRLSEWHALFERDDHGAWPANGSGSCDEGDAQEEVVEDDEDPDVQSDGLRSESLDEGCDQAQDAPSSAEDGDDSEGDEAAQDGDAPEPPETAEQPQPDPDDEPSQAEKDWEDVARSIEMNLETFSKEWGEEAGSLMASLAFANRRVDRYTDFLRRFMVPSEEMGVNPDEFDYIYYTYGLDLYGDMPLVEPLEYLEAQRVRAFAIVVDTSESVSGEQVRRFLAHTFSLLKSSEDYASDVDIHIIQCDAKVQADVRLRRLADVDRLMEGFTVRGFGGTDFRPAFDYVEDLMARGELEGLQGLIYFTDGLGQFPEKPPTYDAAFVFVDDGRTEASPVPPWAIKVIIDEDSINALA